MNVPFVDAEIVNIKPGAGFEGKTYDQHVTVKLSNGDTLDVFDHKMLCKPEPAGKKVKATITVLTGKYIEKNYERLLGIIGIKKEKIGHLEGPILSGRIENMHDDHGNMVVNIGPGTIFVSPARELLSSFNIGDSVYFYGVRLDLDNIEANQSE